MAMSGAGGYDDKMPNVEDYLHDYRKVLERVRASRQGYPISEVRQALREGFESEGVEVWDEVLEDAAKLISAGDADSSA
ncbi:hypothetical protein [Amycolatopsis sp. WAC 04197]|uniref:hypothetical protein n=1 Tax=Amycolatopsis sp. WAC 04197 TaxID=2203199 RepID=UPI000F7703EF|nr:hypothetical protein [Amycolatopsis sp. WAC 04197]